MGSGSMTPFRHLDKARRVRCSVSISGPRHVARKHSSALLGSCSILPVATLSGLLHPQLKATGTRTQSVDSTDAVLPAFIAGCSKHRPLTWMTPLAPSHVNASLFSCCDTPSQSAPDHVFHVQERTLDLVLHGTEANARSRGPIPLFRECTREILPIVPD